jgi:hypothetical protein
MITCLYCGTEQNCDCEERINCVKVGQLGHKTCGWCQMHGCPRFKCGCFLILEDLK